MALYLPVPIKGMNASMAKFYNQFYLLPLDQLGDYHPSDPLTAQHYFVQYSGAKLLYV